MQAMKVSDVEQAHLFNVKYRHYKEFQTSRVSVCVYRFCMR